MQRSTALILVILAGVLFAPLGLVYFISMEMRFSGAFRSSPIGPADSGAGERVWLTTPAFSIVDALGNNRVFVAALKMNNRQEANRLCRWMPIVRDRIQTVVSLASSHHRRDGNASLSLEKRRLQQSLQQTLITAVPIEVDFVDAHVAPGAVLRGGEPVVCDGKLLDKRSSRVYLG